MSSVKENIIKIKVLAALIGVNILKNNWRSMNDGLLSVMVEYLRRNTIYQGVLLQSVYGQLPPRSWSTIRCHYSAQSLSSAAIRIHHQLPPRSWSTTTARCQHDKGSAIVVTTSQHDTESAILDPPLRYLIRDPQVVLHDVAKGRSKTSLDRL